MNFEELKTAGERVDQGRRLSKAIDDVEVRLRTLEMRAGATLTVQISSGGIGSTFDTLIHSWGDQINLELVAKAVLKRRLRQLKKELSQL